MSFKAVLAGKIGDVIYELAAVRRLALDRNTRARVHLFQNDAVSLTEQDVVGLIPLIKSQPYIESAERWDGQMARDAESLTEWFREYEHRQNVVKDLFLSMGFDVELGKEAWLNLETHENGPVLINYTGRYPNPTVDWPGVIARFPDAQFVGHQQEWGTFRDLVGREIPFLATANLMSLAQTIAGCRLFVGSQSAGLAIANGLHKPVLVATSIEYPNCVFIRNNAEYLGVDADFRLKHGY